jgi:hypothetical protein
MNKELTIYANSPAFPPQIVLDQFNQPVAPAPGMSIFEYFAAQAFAALLASGMTPVSAIDEAVQCAEELLAECYLRRKRSQFDAENN